MRHARLSLLRPLVASLVLAAPALPQIVFLPPVSTTLTHRTQGVVAADINLDGHLDLVTLPTFEDVFVPPKFSVLLGDGDGGFGAPITKTVSNQDASRGAVALLNADAFPDFALTVNIGSLSMLTLYFGAGDGTFPTTQNISLNGTSHLMDVAVVELNGDGKPDFVVLDDGIFVFANGKLHTLVSNAQGGYTQLASQTVGAGSQHFALGDIDGDAVLDAVVANHFSGTLAVLIGTPGGGFGAPATLNVGGRPDGIVLHDLDGDGPLDIAYADSLQERLVTMLGDGEGHFATLQTLALPGTPNDVAAGQLDNDSELDLLVSRPGASDVALLRGAGDGTFSFVAGVSNIPNAGTAAIADFDEDNRLDAAIGQATPPPGKLSVIRNQTYPASSPFTDLGHSKPGTNGYPILLADGTLQPGDPMSIALTNGLPLHNASLVLGFSQVNVPFKGGTMIPAVDLLITPLPMDATGSVTLVALWPSAIPAGFTFYLQFWFKDAGATLNEAGSSGLRVVTP